MNKKFLDLEGVKLLWNKLKVRIDNLMAFKAKQIENEIANNIKPVIQNFMTDYFEQPEGQSFINDIVINYLKTKNLDKDQLVAVIKEAVINEVNSKFNKNMDIIAQTNCSLLNTNIRKWISTYISKDNTQFRDIINRICIESYDDVLKSKVETTVNKVFDTLMPNYIRDHKLEITADVQKQIQDIEQALLRKLEITTAEAKFATKKEVDKKLNNSDIMPISGQVINGIMV